LGTWLPGSPQFDVAIDPIDGTTNISKGAPNSISCIAAASPEKGVKVALRDVPSFYMSKLAYGPRVIEYMKRRGDSLHVEMPIPEMLAIVARAVDKRVQDVAVMMLDRPRHKEIVEQIRGAGASLRMIGDGDIAAAMAPSLPESNIDLYMGIGGSPEAVLAAAGIKCLGGEMQCKMWPRDEKERKKLIAEGNEKDLERVYTADDLAQGENIVFCATGISDSALLRGVKSKGTTAITHSILMRAKSKTVRLIRAMHNLQNKTIRTVLFCKLCIARMSRTVLLLALIKIEWVIAVVPFDLTPRKSALSLIPVAQKTMFSPWARSSAVKMCSRSFSLPPTMSCFRSFSSRGHILHCISPPRHLIPAAASTASGEPPMPM